MTYGLTTNAAGVEAKLAAATREEFFHDALAATLEVIYDGAPPRGDYEGQVVPLQAVGDDDLAILRGLVADCLDAARDASGTLHPPRWLAFDAGRVTATLAATSPRTAARNVEIRSVAPDTGAATPFAARLQFRFASAH